MSSCEVPTLSVIVPATERPLTLPACEEAIRAALDEGDELIVQDSPPGAGPAEARNLAARRARGDALVFVDSDVVVHPNAFDLFRRRLAAGADAVFGAYDDKPADSGAVSQFRNLLHHQVHLSGAGEAETFWAGLGAVRREAFEAVGGFDERRFPRPAVEDIDLGMRLRDAGRTIVLEPMAQGTHLKRWTLRTMVSTDLGHRGVPWLLLQIRARRPTMELNLRPRHQLGALAAVTAVVAALGRRPAIAIASLAALPVLNPGLYRALLRRGGPILAVKGLAVHLVHLLTAVAAVPAALLALLRANRGTTAGAPSSDGTLEREAIATLEEPDGHDRGELPGEPLLER